MGQIDITHQRTVAKAEHGFKSKEYEEAIQHPVNPGFCTNRSQKNATPLIEIYNRSITPTTRLDEASTTSYTKSLEELRQRALRQL